MKYYAFLKSRSRILDYNIWKAHTSYPVRNVAYRVLQCTRRHVIYVHCITQVSYYKGEHDNWIQSLVECKIYHCVARQTQKWENKRKFSDQTMTVSLEDKFHKNNLLLKYFTFNMVKQYMQNQSGQKQHTVNIFIVLYKKRKELQKITLTRVKMGSRVSCFVMTSVEWNWCFFFWK